MRLRYAAPMPSMTTRRLGGIRIPDAAITGGGVCRLTAWLNLAPFMLTYGVGVSDVGPVLDLPPRMAPVRRPRSMRRMPSTRMYGSESQRLAT